MVKIDKAKYKEQIETLHSIEDIPDNYNSLPAYSKENNVNTDEIGQGWLKKLYEYTNNCDIHVILDDSGSTTLPLDKEVIEKYKNTVPPYRTPIDTSITKRIEEGVTALYHLTYLLEKTKANFTLEFLNKDKIYSANYLNPNLYTDLRNVLIDFLKNDAPSLYKGTPLCTKLKRLRKNQKKDYTDEDRSRNNLWILILDGEANDYGQSPAQMEKAFKEMKAILIERQNERLHNYVALLSMTDSIDEVKNLIKLDSDIERLDVSDDYFNSLERIKEVYRALEIKFEPYMFTLNDYFVKIIIGPMDADIDHMDEIEKTQKKKKGLFSSRNY